MNSKNNQSGTEFKGFQSPTYTLIPKVVADALMQDLTTGELRVLLYVMFHTFGWKKASDQISLSQFLNGIVKKDGSLVDQGAGLSKVTLLSALRSLEEKNLILRKRRTKDSGECATTEFTLNISPTKISTSSSWPWKPSEFFQAPDDLFSKFLPTLSGRELKVILFIARWTTQTETQENQISIKQMTQGIINKKGEVLTKGAGVSSERKLFEVLSALEKQNLIARTKVFHASGGKMPSMYSLFKEEVPEIIPTPHMPKNTPTKVTTIEPTFLPETIPTVLPQIKPTDLPESEPDTINKTQLHLNTISTKLTQKFYEVLGIKASSKKIEKEARVILELLEKDDFTMEQIEKSFSWIANKYPDTFSVHRLPMLIGQALQAVSKKQEVPKISENLEKLKDEQLKNREVQILEFEKLSEEKKKFWLAKTPKILNSIEVKKAYAATLYKQSQKEEAPRVGDVSQSP